MHDRPRLVVTPGEPAGIGPELCLLTANAQQQAELFYVADPRLLQQRARHLGMEVSIRLHTPDSPAHTAAQAGCSRGSIDVIPVSMNADAVPGRLDPANSHYVTETLRVATRACLSGRFDGLVTGPVHKGVINDAGIPFTGHTEFLQQLCDATPVMMLQSDRLRVALVTTHVPLSQVSRLITAERVTEVIRILLRGLSEDFAIPQPRIHVCGLNPHAGENGHLGKEEIDVLIPVIEEFRRAGCHVSGPLPADTIFLDKILQHTDAILAMYHDQGLPVLKATGFGHAVNITLGLPIVRVSVDHGVALELAGQKQIQTGSFLRAVSLAARMAANRKQKKAADAHPA